MGKFRAQGVHQTGQQSNDPWLGFALQASLRVMCKVQCVMCKVQLGCRVLFQSPTGASDPWRSGGVQWGKYARKHQG